MYNLFRIVLFLFFVLPLTPKEIFAQLERERVATDRLVSETFWTPSLAGMSTVETIGKKHLHVSIMHAFGFIDEGIDNFFGLDATANIRLSVDYGITERWSVGIGRTRFEKVVDLRNKYAILKQTESNKMPLSATAHFNIGVTTEELGLSFGDKLNFLGSMMIARKFNDEFSLQIAPMYARFEFVFPNRPNDFWALGLSGRYQLNRRFSVSAEYLPVLSTKNPSAKNHFAMALNIETGGHVFQLFFTTTQWFNEQFVIARNRDDFFAGDIRFGFNVNRVFSLARRKS
ncbi:MAG: DUF5777 family beta-barrel protein [Balneolaceae bacterium]